MPKAIKQFFIFAAVIAIAMVFVVQFRPGAGTNKGSSGPRCAMEVSGECIPHSDFVSSYRHVAPAGVDEQVLKQLRLRQLVLEGLVERWLLNKDAERLGISVSDDEVTRQLGKGISRFSVPVAHEDQLVGWPAGVLMRFMQGQIVPPPEGPGRRMPVHDPKTGEFDYEKYKRWVSRMSNKTLADFREYQKAEIVAARVRALVRSRVRVSETEAYDKFARDNEKVVVEYVKLERSYYKDHVIDRSDAAVSKWAEENKKEVDEAWGSRKDSYLPECRSVRHIMARVDETDPDPEAAKKKAREKIDKAKKRLDEGEDFATVARALSEDTRTAPKGGELGCFAAGKLSEPNTAKPIDDAAFKLEEGKVSDVIETSHGLHIVKLDKIAKGEAAEKLGRAAVTLDLYLQKESETLAAEGGRQILAAAQGGKKLEDAIHQHLMAVLPEEAKKAYEAGRAGGAKEDDKKEEKEEKKDDKKADAWTDPARPTVRTSDPFTKGGPPFAQAQSPTEAAATLFELEKPGSVPKDLIKLFDGYAVAKLKEKKPVEKKTWEEKREAFMDGMRRDKQRDALVAYVLRLREQYAKEITYQVKVDEAAEPGEGEGEGEPPPGDG
jgi:peptidyl-prolyl cis-trans isomerase D